jgi:methionyl-tRNA synthetase
MSKTAGTAVSVDTAIERHGADALRYFLLREVGFESDGNFTWERFDARYAADLADTYGNLVSRTLSMVQRYRDGVVPAVADADAPLERHARSALDAYTAAMEAYDLQRGAALLIELASHANRYIEETAPWKLAKEHKDTALDAVLASLVRTVARLAVLSVPFMPHKAAALWNVLGSGRPLETMTLADLAGLRTDGQRVAKPPPLFPKPAAASNGLPAGA